MTQQTKQDITIPYDCIFTINNEEEYNFLAKIFKGIGYDVYRRLGDENIFKTYSGAGVEGDNGTAQSLSGRAEDWASGTDRIFTLESFFEEFPMLKPAEEQTEDIHCASTENPLENSDCCGESERICVIGEKDALAWINTKPVKSTGGSSSYYQLQIKRASDGEVFECELGDVLYSAFGGDFDLCNIVKACRRMYLASEGGGKEGTDIEYDANKIKWFADDFVGRKLNGR